MVTHLACKQGVNLAKLARSREIFLGPARLQIALISNGAYA